MGKCTLNFNHSIGDQVKLIDIGVNGYIDSVSFDKAGEMCRIVYWDNGTRNSTWVYPHEIKGR